MTRIAEMAREIFDRLGTRIVLVLAIALLPLAIVSTVRSATLLEQSQARSEAALAGETLRAVARPLGRIERASAVAAALAAILPELLDDPENCADVVTRMVRGTEFSFAGFYDTTGTVSCTNVAGLYDFDIAADDITMTEPAPFVTINREAPISRTSVIFAADPVFDRAGTLLGYAGVSVPHSALGLEGGETPFPMRSGDVPEVAFFTFNGDGDLLTATGATFDEAPGLLPDAIAAAELRTRTVPFTAISRDGEDRTYASVPILGGALFAVGTWSRAEVQETGVLFRFPALFPMLMLLASLVVAYFAAEVLVTRHVRRLRSGIASFGSTRRAMAPTSLAHAPLEIRDMAASYRDMTDTILREEAALEDNVRQKDILLREVHHRVKNNLQLIASIMNMQMRKSRSEEARGLMRGLHDRIMSLATVHKGLYQTSGLADVRADELLSDILQQISHLGTFSDTEVEVEQRLDPLQLSPEQAVPLTLLVTEALTNAFKYIGHARGAVPTLRITLDAGEGRAVRVVVANTLAPEGDRPEDGPPGLGTQLLSAFSQQLRGTLDKSVDDGWFTMTVAFEADPLERTPRPAVF